MGEVSFTEKMLREVLKGIDEGIHVVDAEGRTVFYNRFAARLDGMEEGEVLGNHLLEVFPSLTPKTSTLLKVIRTGEPIYNQQQGYTNRHGKRIVTVNSTMPVLVEGRRVGAMEVSKDITRIQELSEKVIDLERRMRSPRERKRPAGRGLYRFEQILTLSPVMKREIHRARRAAATRSPALVVGETGTGKELLVQSLHSASPRGKGPFIAQNCAAIPSSLLEGILFGTVRGAFTGAEDRPGLFELAEGGSLFLDEIHAMPVDLQAKLLRVLEDGAVRRVGDVKTRPVDVRILAATNEEPETSVQEGRLRKDLYYRIHVVRLEIPPLRERKEDIPLLTRHFIQKYNYRFETLVIGVSEEVKALFAGYNWPGNVRELEHAIEGAMNQVEGDRIELEHLPRHLIASGSGGEKFAPFRETDPDLPLPLLLSRVEEEALRRALKTTGNNVRRAAERLGIPRQTLQYKLKRLGLNLKR
ncbi:sigma-54 interaction domain-containing protein [Kroppenstedtia eburnea]|uniref:sigma-54 interaction domain-containing protein n=1 Tax=Kroppenstedtia eburnea TaxID=714067 RepID=UPI003638FB1E